jgi:transposase InsO family protein
VSASGPETPRPWRSPARSPALFRTNPRLSKPGILIRDFCRANDVRPSVGRTGICYDNAVAESFFGTLKKELIHTQPWPTLDKLRTAVFEYIESYYNRRRRHSTIGYDTPIEHEMKYALTRLQTA